MGRSEGGKKERVFPLSLERAVPEEEDDQIVCEEEPRGEGVQHEVDSAGELDAVLNDEWLQKEERCPRWFIH